MADQTLAERIRIETGLPAGKPVDPDDLAGLFNRYRPDGAGLGRILNDAGVEGEVRRRILSIFQAVRPGHPDDLYFVVRQCEPMDRASAVYAAQSYLDDFGAFAAKAGDTELSDALGKVRVVQQAPAGSMPDEDIGVMMHECLTDFLIDSESGDSEIFLLREAVYTMASDYGLLAYVLCPAISSDIDICAMSGKYFELWRHGIGIAFLEDGIAEITISPGGLP